jgi:hypothetical protein
MGNEMCVADGGTPNEISIIIINETPEMFHLDGDFAGSCMCPGCGSDHKPGWVCQNGKIVQGNEPSMIKSHSNKRFVVSGRSASPLAPNGSCHWVSSTGLRLDVIWEGSGITAGVCVSANYSTENGASINVGGFGSAISKGGGAKISQSNSHKYRLHREITGSTMTITISPTKSK